MKRLLLALAALLVAGCDWNRPPDYFPTTRNSNWEFQGRRLGQDLYEVDSLLGFDYLDDGTDVWILYRLSIRALKGTQDTVFLRKTDAGLWEYRHRNARTGALLLSFPLQVGKTWQYQDPDSGQVTADVVGFEDIVSTFETIRDCARIRYTDAHGHAWEELFGPGVGRVGWRRPSVAPTDSALIFRYTVIR